MVRGRQKVGGRCPPGRGDAVCRQRGVAAQWGPVCVLLAGQTPSQTVRRPRRRLGTFWTWRELVGTVALIPFQPFKLPRRLPVSGPRRPARGGRAQAPGTGADCSGQCSPGRGSGLEPKRERDRQAGRPRLTSFCGVQLLCSSGSRVGEPAPPGEAWPVMVKDQIIRTLLTVTYT